MSNGERGCCRNGVVQGCAALFTFALTACSGGGGLSPLSPGATGIAITAQPTPTPTPMAAPVIGLPTFPVGGSGSCSGTVYFDAAGQYANASVSEPNYSGGFSAASSDATVATASISGTTLTVTAVQNGSATITVSDQHGGSAACPVSITITGGSVS